MKIIFTQTWSKPMTNLFGSDYFTSEQIMEQVQDMEELAIYSDFDAYQDFTDETAIYPEEAAQEYLMLGLMSEVGELAGKMKKELRDGTVLTDEDFAKELGDVLWYVAQLASNRELYLSDIAQLNAEKLSSRQARGTLTGSGDNR